MDDYVGCMYYYTNEFDMCRKEQEAFEKTCPLEWFCGGIFTRQSFNKSGLVSKAMCLKISEKLQFSLLSFIALMYGSDFWIKIGLPLWNAPRQRDIALFWWMGFSIHWIFGCSVTLLCILRLSLLDSNRTVKRNHIFDLAKIRIQMVTFISKISFIFYFIW